ncbi:MAG TPA: Crp/Fnr family transcriptional regulator [Chitinophagales bacterium]|nr:Crp/Fnr family transcriptional regulator [Chitinophagales bacterium]HNM32640.1 Crp/Fnr family transcriptional regulator [Chitinophagales bacterium]
MAHTPFTVFLTRFEVMPEELIIAFESKIQRIELPKKTQLVKKGKICHSLYFIEKGLARNYYEEENKEQTCDIALNGELLVSFSSFISQQPSMEIIELLEDSVLYALHYDDLQQLYRDFPTMERLGRRMAEYYYNSLATKNYQLKFNNTTERYMQLFNAKIEIIRRVPIGIIASYLGMSMETLSRIRSKQD